MLGRVRPALRLCVAIVLLAAAPAHARTMVVRPGDSIAKAVSAASPGDHVLVRRGSYPALKLDGVRPRGDIEIAAYPGEHPRLAGLDLTNVANLSLAGFRISDIAQIQTARALTITGNEVTPNGLVIHDASRLRVTGNHVHDLTIALAPAGVPGARCNLFTPTAGLYPRCGFAFRLYDVSDSSFTNNEIDHIPAN